MHNPFIGFRRSLGWTEGSHSRNPAIDYATPKGAKFGAPEAGIYRHRPSNLSRSDTSAAGHIGELELADGRRIRFCHLDRHIAKNGERVVEGQAIAVTGNTGYVRPTPTVWWPWAGAHMHTYGLTRDGKRWNWTIDAGAAPVSTVTVRRKAKVAAPGRRHATRKSPKKQTIARGKTGTFRGFVRGNWVTANGVSTNIWYVGKSLGNRFWAGSFTEISTDGLTDLTGIVK